MNAYTLKSLDTHEKPPSGGLSSLVFNVPFPDHVPRQFSERYEALRKERHMDDESHYQETSGLLALEVYNADSMRADRDRGAGRAVSVFHRLVQANKGTLRHVEEIVHLESFACNGQKPFSALSLDAASFPTLPALTILDLTHWSPTVADLKTLLAPSGPLPFLQHLIIDHGAQINATDFDDDDEEKVSSDYDNDAPRIETETRSWPALGAFLAVHPTPLRSLSAALLDVILPPGLPRRLDQGWLHKTLCVGKVDNLVVCTAWPVHYGELEPGGGENKNKADLYAHTPGCRHLVYPPDQRPTTGLWPAATEEGRAMENLTDRAWE
ncbi:hypothetical protein DFH09DRAFT_1407671 [Mycena vulgaris]|nr:hypothetical protein DFH09DRAFT_1407671 [Mycena vulgaris]